MRMLYNIRLDNSNIWIIIGLKILIRTNSNASLYITNYYTGETSDGYSIYDSLLSFFNVFKDSKTEYKNKFGYMIFHCVIQIILKILKHSISFICSNKKVKFQPPIIKTRKYFIIVLLILSYILLFLVYEWYIRNCPPRGEILKLLLLIFNIGVHRPGFCSLEIRW